MYLDPGFGSMLIQIIVAAIAAGGAYLLLFRKKLVSLFKKDGAGKYSASAEDEDGVDK
jgi:hypothetical protein